MSILLQRGLLVRRSSSTKLLPFVRKITTITRNTASSLSLDSYCEQNPNDVVYSINKTLDTFIKHGRLDSALKLFDEMPLHDVVSYNLLISGHRRHGFPTEALRFYAEMVLRGIPESASTFSLVIAICVNAGFYKEGVQVHCRAFLLGFCSNVFVGNAIVGLYMEMGLENSALKLFDELPERNLASWNLILRGYCETDRADEMLRIFSRMKSEVLEPNGVTFSYLIKGCCREESFEEGTIFHCHVVKLGLDKTDVFVANVLVDFYSACECLFEARKCFEAIAYEDVISWNSIVCVHAHCLLWTCAVELFSEMQIWGKRPSVRSIGGLLGLATKINDLDLGKQIHSFTVKSGFEFGSVHIQSALINMYGKCGVIESSVMIYNNGDKSLECCNSLMTSLLHCGCVGDAVDLFGLMVDRVVKVNGVTLSTALKALSVSSLSSSKSFTLLHCLAVKTGLESNSAVSCSLIDSYSKHGHINLSRRLFENLSSPNLICFTSIINGYAQNGMGKESLGLFRTMIQTGLKPDEVTFLCLLSGCNHSGLVKEGKFIFDSMKTSFGISPNREHYSCMVDLLGRAGLLDEAEEFLNRSPARNDSTMWSSFLRSCRVHKNETLGRRAVGILFEIDPENPAVCLQASSFYSEIGEFFTATRIREFALARKVAREIGHSLIETTS